MFLIAAMRHPSLSRIRRKDVHILRLPPASSPLIS
jgi:hypothetical protein